VVLRAIRAYSSIAFTNLLAASIRCAAHPILSGL
jgi:hypothetical protein